MNFTPHLGLPFLTLIAALLTIIGATFATARRKKVTQNKLRVVTETVILLAVLVLVTACIVGSPQLNVSLIGLLVAIGSGMYAAARSKKVSLSKLRTATETVVLLVLLALISLFIMRPKVTLTIDNLSGPNSFSGKTTSYLVDKDGAHLTLSTPINGSKISQLGEHTFSLRLKGSSLSMDQLRRAKAHCRLDYQRKDAREPLQFTMVVRVSLWGEVHEYKSGARVIDSKHDRMACPLFVEKSSQIAAAGN